MTMIKIARSVAALAGWLCRPLYSNRAAYLAYTLRRSFVTNLKMGSFASFGDGSLLGLGVRLIEPHHIYIGSHSSICNGCELSCTTDLDSIGHPPRLHIGDGVSIGERSHITCANRVEIGNGVLTGKSVLITDNAHGASRRDIVERWPMSRPIYSSGSVIIEDGVWIGERASIMPNVKIGRGAIVAANAVVTKDVAAYSVVAGVPARVLKQL